MSREKHSSRIWTKAFVSIFIVNFLLHVGEFLSNAVVPLYVDSLGGGAFIVGFVSTIFAVTALALRPVTGPALDCFNKKKLLIIGITITAIAFAIYGFSESVPLLIAGRLIHGVGIGASGPLALAIAGECLPQERLASGIGIFTLGMSLSNAIGPSFGLYLARVSGYRTAFFLSAVIILLSCLPVLLIPDSMAQAKNRFTIRLNNIFERRAIASALIMACLGISQSCVSSYIALYGSARGVEQIGLFFTVNAVSVILSRPLSGAISDKYGFKTSMIPGFIICAAAYVLISRSTSLAMFIVSGVVYAFGFGTISPNTQAIGMRSIPAERRGVAANTIFAGLDVGFLIGGPLSGFVCGRFQAFYGSAVKGYSMTFVAMIAPVAVGFLLFMLDNRRQERLKRLLG